MKKKNLTIIAATAFFAMSLFVGCAKNDTTLPTPSPEITQTGTPVPDEVTEMPDVQPTKALPEETIVPDTPTATSIPVPTETPVPTEEPHEHIFVVNELPATCTADGKTWEECECGEIQNETDICSPDGAVRGRDFPAVPLAHPLPCPHKMLHLLQTSRKKIPVPAPVSVPIHVQ